MVDSPCAKKLKGAIEDVLYAVKSKQLTRPEAVSVLDQLEDAGVCKGSAEQVQSGRKLIGDARAKIRAPIKI